MIFWSAYGQGRPQHRFRHNKAQVSSLVVLQDTECVIRLSSCKGSEHSVMCFTCRMNSSFISSHEHICLHPTHSDLAAFEATVPWQGLATRQGECHPGFSPGVQEWPGGGGGAGTAGGKGVPAAELQLSGSRGSKAKTGEELVWTHPPTIKPASSR